jgi:16S rRNA (guanine(1405)-N(7))-methyltransferase
MIKEVIKNKRYATISKVTIERTLNRIRKEFPNIKDKDLVRKVREELYKTHLAYYKNINYDKLLSELRNNPTSTEIHEKWMRKYDNNRLKSLQDGLYDKVFEITGRPKILLDLASGLNPLSLPWMNLPRGASYYCYDIEKNLIKFLNDYFKLINKNYKAYYTDVITNPPRIKADTALIFKASTCFEWQKPGNTMKVLNGLNTKYAVISLMMRGKLNLRGCRNYFKKLITRDYESFEVVSVKEYVRILKLK